MGLGEPLPTGYDETFQEDLQRIKQEDRSRFDTVVSRCEDIRRNPFKGEWKRWKMDGLYGEHVDDHWVILYEIDPDLAPNHPPVEVDSVYFHRVVHHDNQETAVSNINSIGSSLTFDITVPWDLSRVTTDYVSRDWNPQRCVSQLHDVEVVKIEPEYREDGIFVEGVIPESDEAKAEVRNVLPDELEVEFEQPAISDMMD